MEANLLDVKDFMKENEEQTSFLSEASKKSIWEESQRTFDITAALDSFTLKKEKFIMNREGDISSYYSLEEIIGKGGYGVVKKAIDKTTGEIRAVKLLTKGKVTHKKQLLNELNILKTLDHPNIIKLYEVFEDSEYIYLVMEYWAGGELYDAILEQEELDEFKTAQTMKQIFQAVLYCHKNAIWHRDLKPNNFMMATKDRSSNLKLLDFGLATSYFIIDGKKGKGKLRRLGSGVGTPHFVAPEIIKGDYNQSCDMWSAGVILYLMLGGYPPFDGEGHTQIYDAIEQMDFSFGHEVWDHVSSEAKDLICKLLVPEEERLSPKEALKHPWFSIVKDEPEKVSTKITVNHMKKLKAFQKMKNYK